MQVLDNITDLSFLQTITPDDVTKFKMMRKDDVVIGDLGGYISLKDTKNGDNRKVMLTKELTVFLKNIIRRSHEHIEYVFNFKNGKPISSIRECFKATCDRAGIKDLKFHDLRHTFCTRIAHEGVNPFVIMQIFGHKDTKPAKRYTNPTNEH